MKLFLVFISSLFGIFLFSLTSLGQTKSSAVWESLGGENFAGWSGLKINKDESALIENEAVFRYPDGAKGFYKHGFRPLHDGSKDWREFYGIQFEVKLNDDNARELTVSILRPGDKTDEGIKTAFTVQGSGWHSVKLPWSSFNIETARTSYLLYVKGLLIISDGKGAFAIRNVKVTKGAEVSLDSEIKGKFAQPGSVAEYQVTVGNNSNEKQSVSLGFVRYGWEQMTATVTPSTVSLIPGETRSLVVRVKVAENIPAGGHERQLLQATPNGDASAAARLEFITAGEISTPHILFNPTRWDEVREKVKKYAWAKIEMERLVKQADAWQVPEIAQAPNNDPDDTFGPFLFRTQVEQNLLAAAIAWQLTRDRKYAEKIAVFMRRLSDPNNGYPKTLRACHQALVQEGGFFQNIAMSYDSIRDSGVITPADKAQIEKTFRLFLETINRAVLNGNINNWNLAEVTGALYCSLSMGDMVQAERFFKGPSGILDQLSKGTMADGWWNESSISYNTWVASEFSQTALALENWGINFKDMWVPASYSANVLLEPELSGGRANSSSNLMKFRPFGMTNEVWGPNRRSFRKITDLWDSLLPFLDYRGVMFGVNDSTERKVAEPGANPTESPFEIAYYVFRDPKYAAVIKRGKAKRNLLYGVPELPENTPEQFRDNAVADNVGVVMLRSQTENRPIREQIQAVLHYGSHGWAHGHFDRTNLLSLMRYGRSFYNPEAVWWSYEPFMYKFYVQTSVTKNMVVVDQKMQEASPGTRTLFYSGKMMQATAVETKTRWSNPPYGGMVYDYVPVKTFEEKTWREGRFVPIPKNAPEYGTLTDFTEPILQRRAMIVTDDYVVLADYVKGEKPHVFENLLQMKGFRGIEAADKKFIRHDKQWNPDPVGSAQFTTDVNWYSAEAPVKSSFQMKFGPGADNAGTRAMHSEDGVLNLDVHTLFPAKQQIMVGQIAEEHSTQKRLFYTVRGDGKTLAEGKFGSWILGENEIDVSLEGLKTLELETKTELGKVNTIFWANARIITRDGREIPLSQLPVKYENVVEIKENGKDYFGGPIKIVGTEYKDATAGEPKNNKLPAFIRLDLSGIDAVRFKSVIGGDYPLGDETQRRKTYGIRQEGTSAQFLTLIEPFEDKNVVKSAVGIGSNKLRVELLDGRIQEIEILNFEGDGKSIIVKMTELKDGKIIRTETATPDN